MSKLNGHGMEILLLLKNIYMDSIQESGKNHVTENPVSEVKASNVGAGPVASVDDGGKEGEAKQPKEHTGKLTAMGGATGGTPGMPDAGEGNDNTSRE